MAVGEKNAPSNQVVNVPNSITAARFVLAIVVFVLLPLGNYLAALLVFLLAASTDWIDGYWARKYNQITQLGRIFDPFVDKIIICGTFIFLSAENGSGVSAWMAVVVVGREMMVTVLRSYIEQQGGDFSANMAGKLKMVFQCAAVVAGLATLHLGGLESCPAWLASTTVIAVWIAVLSTIYSGIGYLFVAAKMLGEK